MRLNIRINQTTNTDDGRLMIMILSLGVKGKVIES